MSLSEKQKDYIRELSALEKEKQYGKDFGRIVIIICGSKEMRECGISTEKALEKSLEIIKQSKSSAECISKILLLAGISNI